MAGTASQPPIASPSVRSSPVVNGSAALDYINGHGPLPDSPASSSAPVPPTSKKGKSKKAADPNETGKLLAAKINQLELDAAGDKEQEAEIDMRPRVLQDYVKEHMRSLELLSFTTFKSRSSISFARIGLKQPKLINMPVRHDVDIEREVKKATRDLSSLLHGMESPLLRLEAVQKKYTELLADMKRLDRENVKSKKRADQLQKERDHGRSELSKTVSMKEKLEKLCREFTRENKKVKDEYKKLEDSEKKSREGLGDKTEGLLWNVDERIERRENPESQKLNIEMDELFRLKFKSFIEQYELRELHFHSLMRTKECEVQYSLARFEQQRKLADNESTRSRTLSAQVSTFSQTETELRSQLNIYVEKFKQVEDTLNNSNDLFLTFRKEMEEMSKKTKRLEKENLNLTRKHDLTNRNILEMAEERTRVNKEMETLRKKNNTLESVIRRMQEQGRAPATGSVLEGDEAGTESDYEEDDYDEGSEEGEYDDDTEEEALQAQVGSLPTFGPVPPPPPSTQAQVNGKVHGEMNGVKPPKFVA
ncbi:hypothetical protein MMC22_001274 [Lobaria immixta]|nr:hypothetical protein [Lobaria immixta]